MSKIALYLSGGGAKGAYQAGVLKAIAAIVGTTKIPFDVISGVSVGSINAAIIAENAHDFIQGTNKLEQVWESIHSERVFNSSNYEVSKSVFRNIANVFVRQRQSGHLLDTTPLKEFVQESINFDLISDNIDKGNLQSIEIISNCYELEQTVSFYQSSISDFEDWSYPRHISQRVQLSAEHIIASSALPLFFPTVEIDGFHYGDGSVGLVFPLRGDLKFNVEKILIIGTRAPKADLEKEFLRNSDIGFARVLGSMLNGIFLDNLDRDIEMVNRMNEIASLLSLWKKRRSPWRPVQTLYLRPSLDIATIAQLQYKSLPTLLRYMLNVLGAKKHSGDLLSFLLFEPGFTRQLIQLGYEDTLAAQDSIKAFFE
jgi:NTE family protein